MKLNKREVYTGTYKGVNFEINSFTTPGVSAAGIQEIVHWTFYLLLQLARIPEESNPDSYWLTAKRTEIVEGSGREFINYNEYDSPLGTLHWHYGITWYSKVSTEDNTRAERVIKAGCNYSHYGDEGRKYNVDHIVEDVKSCIESFRKQVPGYKYYCSTVGGYWDVFEGELSEDGEKFISNKGKQWRIDQGWA